MPLQVDGDDLPAFGERREVGAEHLDRSETAVQQDERSAGAVGLVIELDAVHVRVVAHTVRLTSPGALRGARDWCLSLHGRCDDGGGAERRGHGTTTNCRVSSCVLATAPEAPFSEHDERGSAKSTGVTRSRARLIVAPAIFVWPAYAWDNGCRYRAAGDGETVSRH